MCCFHMDIVQIAFDSLLPLCVHRGALFSDHPFFDIAELN